MTSQKWSTLRSDEAPRSPLASLVRVLEPLPESKTPSLLRSASGWWALILDRTAIDDCADISLAVDKTDGGDAMGVLAPGVNQESIAEDELAELATLCDLIAVPHDAPIQRPADFSACGKLTQLPDSPATREWSVWQARHSPRGLFIRGAPIGGGEADDNLDARAEWFRKRH